MKLLKFTQRCVLMSFQQKLTWLVMVTVSPSFTVSSLFPGSAVKSYKTCALNTIDTKHTLFKWMQVCFSNTVNTATHPTAPTVLRRQIRAQEKLVQLVLLGILCWLGTGINQKQGWALRYLPRFDKGGRNYSDPHLQIGTSPRAQQGAHTHKHTHAWVRGNEVKTGLNLTHGVFLSWSTWLFCCLFFKY